MRLAAKLILLFLIGLSLIVGLFAHLTIQQDRRLAIAEHQRHAADLAATLKPSIDQAIQNRTAAELPSLVTQTTKQLRHVRVRWVEYSAGSDRSRRPMVPVDMIVTRREVTTISMPDSSGKKYLYTYVPVDSGNLKTDDAGIEISALDPVANDLLSRSVISSLLALLGVTTLSGLVILVGGIKMVGEPLNRLIDKVHRVGQGDFSQPVQLSSNDELGRLGSALNAMCDQLVTQRRQIESEAASRLATVEQLRRAERLNMVGRMAAGIAHEIGTPLNVVTGRAELIASGQLSADASRQSALAIQSEAQRIAKTVRELLDFARQSTPNRMHQDLNELVLSTFNLMRPLVEKMDAELQLETASTPIIADIDPTQIQQVLTNLIINAAQSTTGQGRVSVVLSKLLTSPDTAVVADHDGLGSENPQRPYCKISIEDNGHGISDADRQHIFEPFFTTKDVGEGTGLGLSISHGIIQEHDGWIEVDSKPGVGSCFSIFLPAVDSPGATP